MTREEWLALAERIEKATEPNREIDARISVSVGAVVMRFSKVTGKWAFWTTPVEPRQSAALSNVSGNEDDAFRALSEFMFAPRYTGSLDTITALIERELPGWTLGLHSRLKYDATFSHAEAGLSRAHISTARPALLAAQAATLALALCAAFCRAMAERD